MSNRLLYLLPALVLAILALVLALVGLERQHQQAAASPVVMVAKGQPEKTGHTYWVATHDKEVGSTLEKDDLTQVTANVPLEAAIPTSSDLSGKQLRRALRAGEIVTRSHLEAESLLARAVAPGYRAVAIPIDDVVATGGLLAPGDLVDVLASFRRGPGRDNEPLAMVLLQGIEVLAVKGQLHDLPASDKDSNNKRNATAVLSVPATELARLMLASSAGTLRLAATGSGKAERDGTSRSSKQVVKLAQLLPQAPRPAARAPTGQKVEVFEGAQARSTYVH